MVYKINFKYNSYGEFTSWDFENLFTVNKRGALYPDLELTYEPQKGTPYYLVYVIYSTGDSFSHASSESMEIIDLYKSKEEAAKCRGTL
jgi:hypothetical protein